MIEKEIRYKITDTKINKILSDNNIKTNSIKMLDIVLGKDGFNSLEKYGYIVRIRQKNENLMLEMKQRIDKNEWLETNIPLNNIKDCYNILKTLGLEAYLFIKRDRMKFNINNLKICIDNVSLIGKYIEIEYQESNEEELKIFIEKYNLKGSGEPLYGDIFKEKVENDIKFKEKFIKELNKIIL